MAAFRPFSMLVTWWWRAWSPPTKVPRLKGSLEAIDTWAPFISSTWLGATSPGLKKANSFSLQQGATCWEFIFGLEVGVN